MHAIDQYTAPLLNSQSRKTLSRYIAGALRGKSTDERIAVGADLAEGILRHSTRPVFEHADELRRVHELRHARARDAALAVGDNCNACVPPGPNADPMCTADGRRVCDYDRIGFRTLTTAGNAAFQLTPVPGAGNSWWKPRMVRMYAHLTADPSIPAWEGLFLTSITVGTSPIEGFNAPPTAAVQAGVHFGDYVTPTPPGIPVGWPSISNQANERSISIDGIGLWPAASNFIAYVSILGNVLPTCDGMPKRINGDSVPVPTIPGTSVGKGWSPA